VASQTLIQTAAVAKVNLLPPEIDEKRKERRVQAGLAGAVAATVGVVAVLYMGQVSALSSANDDLATERATGSRLTSQEKTLQNVRDIYASADAKKALLDRATGAKVLYSSFLTDLSLSIPDNVWLTNVTFDESLPVLGSGTKTAKAAKTPTVGIGTVNFSGVAFDHDDVAAFLEALAKQSGYANAYFTSSTEELIGTRKVFTFQASVVLTDAALASKKPVRG
jgi:Tfp pilus assembly protein PilN